MSTRAGRSPPPGTAAKMAWAASLLIGGPTGPYLDTTERIRGLMRWCAPSISAER